MSIFEVKPPQRTGPWKKPRARSMARDNDRLYDNKLEAEYAAHLEAERQVGKIEHWWAKPFKVRLANNCTYEVDFMVQELDGSIRVDETKGFMREDALLKIKFFVQLYPFPLWVITKEKCPGGYEWKRKLFVP